MKTSMTAYRHELALTFKSVFAGQTTDLLHGHAYVSSEMTYWSFVRMIEKAVSNLEVGSLYLAAAESLCTELEENLLYMNGPP